MNVSKVWIKKLNKGKLLGFADVTFTNGMSWSGFRLFKNDNGDINVLPPSRQGKDKEGNDTWYNVIRFDLENPEAQELNNYISDAVRREYSNQVGEDAAPPKRSSEQVKNNSNDFPDNGDDLPF